MVRGSILLVVLAALVAVSSAPAAAAGPLRTGIVDEVKFAGAGKTKSFDRTKTTGASVVRLVLNWHDVAHAGEPADPTDPGADEYYWVDFDDQVRKAKARGFDIIASVQYAPPWVGERDEPDPVALGEFAVAAAERYRGDFVPDGATVELPRIRHWQVWNEPNRVAFISPQFDAAGNVVSVPLYREMVNEVAAAVRGVHEDNLVVAGGLAPLGSTSGPAPMRFLRELTSEQVSFDVWSHHPYTSGGPTHKAAGSGNVALGNLPTMRKLLRERVAAGRVDTTRKVQFWVTEFSWDTKPPDPKGVPMKLHGRWTSEALYRMWLQGISLVTWFRIQDDPLSFSHYQSGFYTVAGKRKRSLRAFRFPFVAFRRPGRIEFWGRTPTSGPGKVAIQVKVGRRWRTVRTLRATPAGMFRARVKTPYAKGMVRAKTPREASLPFSLTRPPDRFVNPFGCGGGYKC